MWNPLKNLVLKVLMVPPEPEDPLGAPGSLIVFRASPNYYKYRLVTWAIGWVIFTPFALGLTLGPLIGGIAAFANGEALIGILLLLVGVLLSILVIFQLILSYSTLRLDYEMRWYKVTDRSLRIREGVWHVREMTMTFDNIQNISVTQGPIQRLLKIADLKVQTAGGGAVVVQQGGEQHQIFNMHVGYFRGIDNAQEVMNLMNERLRRARGTGLGDHDDEQDVAPVFAPPAGAVSTQVVAPGSSDLTVAARALLDEARAFRLATEAARF